MSQTSRDRVNSRRVRTHEKNSGETVRRLGTIIQGIFCAQSGASILLIVWKWFGESRYPGAFPPVLENFFRAFFPGPTDRPWVSEDETKTSIFTCDELNYYIKNVFDKACPALFGRKFITDLIQLIGSTCHKFDA